MTDQATADLFSAQDNYLLLIHRSPDGDAVASSLALYLALRSLGKSVDVVCVDPIPVQFQFLPSVRKIKRDFFLGDYDAIVTLDCGDAKRTGFHDRLKESVAKHKLFINIDHHPKNDLHGLATHNIVDYKAAATASIIYNIVRSLSIRIDYRIATCLLTGLYTDTGGFKHPNTTPEVLQLASTLLAQGARLKDITRNIAQLSSVPRLRLWGIALSRIERHPDLDVVSTYLSYRDILSTGSSDKDIAGIAALLSTLPAGLAIMVIEASDQSVQIRMRAKNKAINVLNLATYLGGGGQKHAAGFTCQKV